MLLEDQYSPQGSSEQPSRQMHHQCTFQSIFHLNMILPLVLKETIFIWISTSRTQTSLLSVSEIHYINWSILNFNVHFKAILHVQIIIILIVETIKFIISCRQSLINYINWRSWPASRTNNWIFKKSSLFWQ